MMNGAVFGVHDVEERDRECRVCEEGENEAKGDDLRVERRNTTGGNGTQLTCVNVPIEVGDVEAQVHASFEEGYGSARLAPARFGDQAKRAAKHERKQRWRFGEANQRASGSPELGM